MSEDLVVPYSEIHLLRKWADDMLATGAEPPWTWYQFMKLRETLDVLLEQHPEPKVAEFTGLRIVSHEDA